MHTACQLKPCGAWAPLADVKAAAEGASKPPQVVLALSRKEERCCSGTAYEYGMTRTTAMLAVAAELLRSAESLA